MWPQKKVLEARVEAGVLALDYLLVCDPPRDDCQPSLASPPGTPVRLVLTVHYPQGETKRELAMELGGGPYRQSLVLMLDDELRKSAQRRSGDATPNWADNVPQSLHFAVFDVTRVETTLPIPAGEQRALRERLIEHWTQQRAAVVTSRREVAAQLGLREQDLPEGPIGKVLLSRAILVTSLQGLERLLAQTPERSPDRPQLINRLVFEYIALELSARRDGRSSGDPKFKSTETTARERAIHYATQLETAYPRFARLPEVRRAKAAAQRRARTP